MNSLFILSFLIICGTCFCFKNQTCQDVYVNCINNGTENSCSCLQEFNLCTNGTCTWNDPYELFIPYLPYLVLFIFVMLIFLIVLALAVFCIGCFYLIKNCRDKKYEKFVIQEDY